MHYFVTGRVDGDDEDSYLLSQAASKEEARLNFIAEMLARADDIELGEICVNYIVSSESSITVRDAPQW